MRATVDPVVIARLLARGQMTPEIIDITFGEASKCFAVPFREKGTNYSLNGINFDGDLKRLLEKDVNPITMNLIYYYNCKYFI